MCGSVYFNDQSGDGNQVLQRVLINHMLQIESINQVMQRELLF